MEFVVQQFTPLVYWFGIATLLFTSLSFVIPNIPGQKIARKGILTDMLYWFATPIISGSVYPAIIAGFAFILALVGYYIPDFTYSGFRIFVDAPLLLQVGIILLLSDILQYWSHRLFHGKYLWKFHSIHHSSTEIDWLSSSRFHPVNIFVHSTLITALVYSLGFSTDAILILVPFNILYSCMVHANINWTFGPLKTVFASPIFHRWHHTFPEEGGDKNFAPTFSFLDILFGTYYMPKGVIPTRFGIREPMSENFFEQMLYPFKKHHE